MSAPGATVSILAVGNSVGGRYQLRRCIAVGGMGEVWEAVDYRLGRSVAVKVLRPELSHDEEFLQRFRVEARTVASLDHPGIAGVHDYGEDTTPAVDGSGPGEHTAYLVMELVRGEPLSAIIARGPVEPAETLRLMEQAAHALAAAHQRGFVHRDVKPGNILVREDGRVKLTDFGIAKAANALPMTQSGMVMGTAHYIAPEQATGAEAGPTGDVYSLGIVGYECLAGHRPFRAENAVAVAMMQVRDEPPPLPPHIPEPVRHLIMGILVKDPGKRYSGGAELAAAVAAVRRGELPAPRSGTRAGPAASNPVDPAPVPAARRSPPRRNPAAPRARSGEPIRIAPTVARGRTLLTVVFLVIAVLAVVATLWYLLGGSAETPDPISGEPEASTVLSREAAPAGPAVAGRPFGPTIPGEAIR